MKGEGRPARTAPQQLTAVKAITVPVEVARSELRTHVSASPGVLTLNVCGPALSVVIARPGLSQGLSFAAALARWARGLRGGYAQATPRGGYHGGNRHPQISRWGSRGGGVMAAPISVALREVVIAALGALGDGDEAEAAAILRSAVRDGDRWGTFGT